MIDKLHVARAALSKAIDHYYLNGGRQQTYTYAKVAKKLIEEYLRSVKEE